MDAIDRLLLNQLLRDARVTYQDLGRAVTLSANTVAERVRRLRASGVISGYHAELDLSRLGRGLHLMSDVRLREGADLDQFERGLVEVEQVIGAVRLTGDYDFLLQIACADAAELETVIDRLKRNHDVRESRSRLVLHEVPLSLERLVNSAPV
ncbi:MAG TPA: Lrp/AsnC family transcriptional regulator [Solirubrobacteraceae bacterium]|nr:Lrp/AsnC family transcriptional regulator [Solirubrobacteraceae bacterium]